MSGKLLNVVAGPNCIENALLLDFNESKAPLMVFIYPRGVAGISKEGGKRRGFQMICEELSLLGPQRTVLLGKRSQSAFRQLLKKQRMGWKGLQG